MNTLWQDAEKLLSSGSISEIEKQLSITFPISFIEIGKKHNGGRPVNNIFDTDKSKERVFSNLLNFNLEDESSILNTWQDTKERLPNLVIPFATDPGGNYICFDFKAAGEPSVLFWNHEENFVIIDGQMEYPEVDTEYKLHNIEFVAPSFSDFLFALYSKEEVDEDFSDFEVL